MRTRPFGPGKVSVPVLGQGTWRLRRPAEAAQALEEGLRLGMTHVDTAEMYERDSGSETILGPIVHQHRDAMFLASKVLPQNATLRGTKSACKDSLVRLQTDRLDLYYLHWPGAVPVAETMRAMLELRDAGSIRHVGVSNFDVAELEEAKAALGPGVLAANQVRYHLEDREVEGEVLPWCRKNGVAVVAYSPFGAGRWIKDRARLAALEGVAREAGKTARQVALAFLTRDPQVFAIPKAESLAHLRENAGGDFELSQDAAARIDAAFVPGLRTA
ncbi:MAG: aldo/keto reductase [Halobacteriales archaeon]|nr:aldo/keto reductase [Halobacteriales archaeon]